MLDFRFSVQQFCTFVSRNPHPLDCSHTEMKELSKLLLCAFLGQHEFFTCRP